MGANFQAGDLVCFDRKVIEREASEIPDLTTSGDSFWWNGEYFFNKIYTVAKVNTHGEIKLVDDPDELVEWDNMYFRHTTGIDIARIKLNV